MPRPRWYFSQPVVYRLLLGIGFPAVFALTLWLMVSQAAVPKPSQTGEGDLGLFKAVVNAQQLGRPYYEVYGAESRVRGYPTRSVFNWRQPLLLRGLALLSPRFAIVLI